MTSRRRSRKCSRGRVAGGSRCRRKPGPKKSRSHCRRVKSGPRKGRCYKKVRRHSRRHSRKKSRSHCRRVKSGPRKGRCYKKVRRHSRRHSRGCSRGRIAGGSRCRKKPGPKRSRGGRMGWINALRQARDELGLGDTYVTINRGAEGIALYKRACDIHGNKTKNCQLATGNAPMEDLPAMDDEVNISSGDQKKINKGANKLFKQAGKVVASAAKMKETLSSKVADMASAARNAVSSAVPTLSPTNAASVKAALMGPLGTLAGGAVMTAAGAMAVVKLNNAIKKGLVRQLPQSAQDRIKALTDAIESGKANISMMGDMASKARQAASNLSVPNWFAKQGGGQMADLFAAGRRGAANPPDVTEDMVGEVD